MAQLHKQILSSIQTKENIQLPAENVWQLPEKVLQFGTGVLLRGLPEYYINKANNKGIFNGRVVVVKSTKNKSDEGDTFTAQNNLYTQCIKGIENDEVKENYIINAVISRVINANENWQDVLQCAHNPQLQIIISNTTEVGISLLQNDDVNASPPQSFPGKLLAFLFERYKAFEGSVDSGVAIIPTELLVDNGKKLKAIVVELAQQNHLEKAFIGWVEDANDWCSSLVDRIVPGALSEKDKFELEKKFGYKDELAIVSEPYNLWAIETKSERTKQLLSFSEADTNVIITNNIQKYRELKLRLLNATHTFSCALAFIKGFTTVDEAMQNQIFHRFVTHLMFEEIIPCLVDESITKQEAEAFAAHVINRFSNPFIQHQWLSISMQYSNKIKQRCLPLILSYHQQIKRSKTCMTLGFAAYLLFMKATLKKDNLYFGKRGEKEYLIQDNEAAKFYLLWQENNADKLVSQVFADADLWNNDLTLIPHFKAEVSLFLNQLLSGVSITNLVTSVLHSST